MTDGNILGTTKAALGSRPGEKVALEYTGNITHGDTIRTYLSNIDAYQVTSLEATGDIYHVGVYQVYGEPYGEVYFNAVYDDGTNQADVGSTPANSSCKVNALILGDR